MYEYLRGRVACRGEGFTVLEANGVGYRLLCSASTLRTVPAEGEARLFTHLIVRDDRQELYGFAGEEERHLFCQLLQVGGVGPAVAMALLSAYEPAVLASHIATGDLALLTRVKGVGKRTGERILVELRDRVRREGGVAAGPRAAGGVRGDAILALCSLGLPRAEAERRIAAVKGEGLDLEEIVTRALK